ARCPGSERRRASTEGTFLRASPVVLATVAAYRPPGRPNQGEGHRSRPQVRCRPMSDTDIRPAFQSSELMNMVRGGAVDIVPAGGFQTEEMILNIGPQHPSTHGVLRIVVELDGEVIRRAEPVIGYMHRGAEKLAEFRDARQTLVLMNRHDWLSAFNNELGWTMAVERLAGIEGPGRAPCVRTRRA